MCRDYYGEGRSPCVRQAEEQKPGITHREERIDIIEAILEKRGYECPCLVGRGTFSEVYRVKKKGDGKFYACKVSLQRSMLFREARLLAALEHPLFPEFYEIWQEKEIGFLVMEYVSGASLESFLVRRGNFSKRQAVRIAVELAEGFVHLHEGAQPILYRDLKPHNIQIREDGRVKLLDFGCACFMEEREDERVRVCVGSPGFAAPEQLLGEQKAGTAGDIYAFGRVLQCIGEKDAALSRLAEACIAKEPKERPASFRLCLYLLTGRFPGDFFKKYRFEKNILDI